MERNELASDVADDLIEAAITAIGLPHLRLDEASPPPTAARHFALAITRSASDVHPGRPSAEQRQILGLEIGRAVLIGLMRQAQRQSGVRPGPAPEGALFLSRTNQPLPNDDDEPMAWAFKADVERIRPTICAPMVEEISFEATARLDNGQHYNAWFANGAIHRLSFTCNLLDLGESAVYENV